MAPASHRQPLAFSDELSCVFYSPLVYSLPELWDEREEGCAQQFLCAFQNNRNAPTQLQQKTHTHTRLSCPEQKKKTTRRINLIISHKTKLPQSNKKESRQSGVGWRQ